MIDRVSKSASEPTGLEIRDLTITYDTENGPLDTVRNVSLDVAPGEIYGLVGESGSGKTTQLPKICLEIGRGAAGLIGVTQPRRIAARTAGDRRRPHREHRLCGDVQGGSQSGAVRRRLPSRLDGSAPSEKSRSHSWHVTCLCFWSRPSQ